MKIALIGLLVGMLMVLAAWLGLRRSSSPAALYRLARPTLLTEPEQVLFHRLCEAFPDKHVFPQVALNQVVGVASSVPDKRQRAVLVNQIQGKALDFLVCGPDTAALLAIELDEKSHDRADRRRADQQKAAALASAGIKLVRFNVAQLPDTAALAALLQEESTEEEVHD